MDNLVSWWVRFLNVHTDNQVFKVLPGTKSRTQGLGFSQRYPQRIGFDISLVRLVSLIFCFEETYDCKSTVWQSSRAWLGVNLKWSEYVHGHPSQGIPSSFTGKRQIKRVHAIEGSGA